MKTCPNCGRMYSDSVGVCAKCGTSLAAPKPAPAPASAQPARPAQTTYTPPAQSSQTTYSSPAQSAPQTASTPPAQSEKKSGGALKILLPVLVFFIGSFLARNVFMTSETTTSRAPVPESPVSSAPAVSSGASSTAGSYMLGLTLYSKLSDVDAIEQVQVWFSSSADADYFNPVPGPAAFEIGFNASNFRPSSVSRQSIPTSWTVFLGKADGTVVEVGTIDGGVSWGAVVTSEELSDYEAVLIIPDPNFRGSFDYTLKIDGTTVPLCESTYVD